MEKLEQLLNSLIEKGWEPRGEREPIYILSSKKLYIPDTMEVDCSLRDLVSKESGLWQFVCENKLYNPDNRGYWGKNVTIVGEYPTLDGDENIGYRDYEYYLIESALKDESELEQFLLDNIKVGNI